MRKIKRWIGIFVALSLVLVFSFPTYAQKAKVSPMSTEEADKMMEECMKMMNTSMEKMKDMHEKMHKGEMKVDPAQMKKVMKSVQGMQKEIDMLKSIGP